MSSAILSIIFGLASAVCWGTGDFTGGYTSKRTPVYTVTLGSLLVGGTLLLLPALLLAEPIPSINSLIIGGFAGIFGTLGLVALYLGLSSGQMGVVSPVAALVSATLPVVFGIIGEGIPPFQQLVGFIFAFIAVWFLSRGNNTISPVRLHDLKLPVLAGIGFGSFFILIDHASNESILWPLISATVGSVIMLLVLGLVRGGLVVPTRNELLFIALVGTFDTAGSATYAMASRLGRMDIAAVLASLGPAFTVLLAWIILKERLSSRQWLGVGTALIALMLIAF